MTWLCVPVAQVFWNSKDALSTYEDKPGVFRHFCSSCGSSLAWQQGNEVIEISVGSIDHNLLESFQELSTPSRNFWLCRKIVGVTDVDGGVMGNGAERFRKGADTEKL